MSSRFDLEALRAFDAVARTGSVSGAAGETGLSPGEIDRHMEALGEDLGVSLVERDGRSLRLTAAGESLAQGLRPAFDEIGNAISLARSLSAVRGTVRLSAGVMFAKVWLVPRIHGFAGGEIDIVFHDDPGETGRPAADADLAVIWGPRPVGVEYGVEKLGEEEAVPVCAPEVGRRIAEGEGLAGVPLLHYADNPSGWEWPTWPLFLQKAGIDGAGAGRDIRLGRGLIMDAVRDGQGLALLSTTLAHDDLAAGRLVRPFAASMAVGDGYWLLTPPAGSVRPEVAAFCDWLRSEHSACFGARAGFDRSTPADA